MHSTMAGRQAALMQRIGKLDWTAFELVGLSSSLGGIRNRLGRLMSRDQCVNLVAVPSAVAAFEISLSIVR